MERLIALFASFAGFCTGVVLITETINRIFKIEGQTAKFFMSWAVSLGLACIGFGFQLGFFSDCGAINEWQGWVKAVFIGVFCAVCSNKTYDMNEIWRALQIIFSFFDKDGKAIRMQMAEESKKKKMMR